MYKRVVADQQTEPIACYVCENIDGCDYESNAQRSSNHQHVAWEIRGCVV